jgi:spore coat polysaccharide biosynthesis protein SpsF
MKTIAIVQARMGSTRLPGKVLRELSGETVLTRVIGRVRRMRRIDDLVIATTTQSADDPIVVTARQNAVQVFRGSEEDVLDRYYQAACASKAEVVVRITSDCPLIDPEVSDDVIQQFFNKQSDYASNILERTYPRGLDTEVMTLDALRRAWEEASEPYQRAHVTPYLYQNPQLFKLLSITGTADHSQHRWTLDTGEDLEFLQAVYARLIGKSDFGWRDVLHLIEREPALAETNRTIAQKVIHEG